MINIRTFAAAALLVGGMSNALAATYWEDRFRYDQDTTDKYPPAEVSIDLFGAYTDHDVRDYDSGDNWGGGLGVNFFFSRMIGIGVDSHTDRWQFPQHANASLIVRFPSSAGFAPYGFGGAGRDWDNGQWTAHAGGGLELRLNKFTGLFADGRVVFPEDTPDYAFARSEEHTSELQSQSNLVCRLLLEKKKKTHNKRHQQ